MKVSIIGVGGAGMNSALNMACQPTENIRFIGVNTNTERLDSPDFDLKIVLKDENGDDIETGGVPKKGQDACSHSHDEIMEMLKSQDVAFIVSGLGGGTGSGATPVIANICAELGLMAIAACFYPFSFETKKREGIALKTIKQLGKASVPAILIHNDRLRDIAHKSESMTDIFKRADELLLTCLHEIISIASQDSHLKVDNVCLLSALKKCDKTFQDIACVTN